MNALLVLRTVKGIVSSAIAIFLLSRGPLFFHSGTFPSCRRMMLYQLEYVLRSKGKKGGAKLCFAPDDFYATTLNPDNPSACGCGWGDAACAEPWLRSDEY